MNTQPLTTTSIPLYGPGIHTYLIDDLELGARAAAYLDSENNCGWSALLDLRYERDMRSDTAREAAHRAAAEVDLSNGGRGQL